MSKQTITLSKGTDVFLTLYSGADTWAEADYQLIEMRGFDDFSNVDIQTTQKLFGAGSYVVSKTVKEREFSIKARVNDPAIRDIQDALFVIIGSLEPITVTREISTLPGNKMLEAYINGLEWNQDADDEVEFVISLKSPSAMPTTNA